MTINNADGVIITTPPTAASRLRAISASAENTSGAADSLYHAAPPANFHDSHGPCALATREVSPIAEGIIGFAPPIGYDTGGALVSFSIAMLAALGTVENACSPRSRVYAAAAAGDVTCCMPTASPLPRLQFQQRADFLIQQCLAVVGDDAAACRFRLARALSMPSVLRPSLSPAYNL